MSFADVNSYNENLRAQDAARAARRQQPAGLASFQARKAAQEAARLAPYSVVKDSYYSSAPWAVYWDGKAIGEFFPTKKAAVAWIEQQKEQKTTDNHSEQPAQDAEQTETTDDHSTQEQPAEQKEEKNMKKVEFAQDAIIVNGQEYAARYEYGETPRGHYLPTIRIYTALSGSACVVELPDDDSEYNNARAAMEKAQEQPETPAQDAEQPAEQTDETPAPTAQEEPQEEQTETTDDHSAQAQEEPQEEPQEQPETPAQDAEQPAEQTDETPTPTAQEEPQEQEEQAETTDDHSAQAQEEPQEEQPAPDPKQARGPVPEKTFVGTSISGHGFSIVFDGGCNRTRVIVCDDAKEKARPIIEKAGFYYSAALDSWNKKLTFRAYRAAQALAAELEKALAA